MTSYSKHKWECISPGEYDTTYKCSACGALFTDQADDPNSLIPEFGCTVTTDLSNKSVEELTSWFNEEATSVDGIIRLGLAYDEIARRLEEAQQQLELYAAEMSSAREAGFYSAQELWSAYQTAQQRNAAHDAKVAAEAKTEALEEAKALVLKRGEQICGAIDPKRTAIELGLKAAEYRAKATEAGRKE